MSRTDLSDADVVRIGREIYDQRIRAHVEPAENNRLVVVDIETGDYEIADAAHDAIDRIKQRHPEGLVYTHRAGHRTAYRLRSRVRRDN